MLNDSTVAVSATFNDAGRLAIAATGDITLRNGLLTASAGKDGGDIVIRSDGIHRQQLHSGRPGWNQTTPRRISTLVSGFQIVCPASTPSLSAGDGLAAI